jgi:hypothetical protein
MTRHRGLVLALGLCALIGLTAREGRAETITMTLTWSGGSLTFDNTSPLFALPGSSSTSLLVNTNAVNTFLNANGSEVNFSSLGASSNFPGAPAPGTGTLSESGIAVLNGTGAASAITVSVSEGGFLNPVGPSGTLSSAQAVIYTNVAAGATETSSSSYNALSTAPLVSTSTGPALQHYSLGNSLAIAPVGPGYSLDNTIAINFAGSPSPSAATNQFSVAATISAIPEPTSVIMMLTGVPLPLVVLGLLRRRRAAA